MSFLRHFVVTGPIFEAKQNFFLNNSAEIKNQDFFNLMKTDKKNMIWNKNPDKDTDFDDHVCCFDDQ